MASSIAENEPSRNRNILSLYSNYIWNRLHGFYAFSSFNFIGTFSNLRDFASLFRSRKRWECFPLPLSSRIMCRPSRVHGVLEDVFEHVLKNLHSIQKNIKFWQSTSERSDSSKSHFIILERGPRAFVDETLPLLRGRGAHGSSTQQLTESACIYIEERLTVLTTLRNSLAAFLAQVYFEVDKIGQELVKDPEQKLPSLLGTINDLFTTLEASIGHLHANRQSDSSVDGTYSFPLLFEKLPEINHEGSQWTDCEIRDAINCLYRNLHKLDNYISIIVSKHKKPRKITQYWIHYSCGAVGLSICSIWLLRHSRLMGSSDIDNWIQDAKDSTIGFYTEHVEKPLLSIRDELFETFRKKHEGMMEQEEVQLTSNSLHRMLLAFSEQIKGENFPENSSDLAMLEIVMARYEKELTHPIQGLLGGELARALLIQVQKLKLDIETAMLELNQIRRANEINFAILAALPAFFLSFLLMMGVRRWFKQDKKAEGRGKIARVQRRLLVAEVESNIRQYTNFAEQGTEKDAQYTFGLVLYSLNRLCNSVRGHAEASGEWQRLRQDIISLASPNLSTADWKGLVSRLDKYDCLLPVLSRM